MKELIRSVIALATIVITIALLKASKRDDKGLDHPERIKLRR